LTAADTTVPRVAIVGPTASGKSSVAMEVARRLGDVDVVSIDSMQVYRGMDIGTAKPSAAERAEVPHHLIDLVEPDADFTVAAFRSEYDRAIARVGAAGHRALLVGGTGLYHRVVIDGFELPGQWPDVRAALDAEFETSVLYARLQSLDPSAASKIEPGNRRRVLRALEVCIGSGRLFSSFGPGVDAYPESGVVQIGLRWPREVIAQRVEQRVRRMVEAGLIAEVERLAQRGLSRTASQALGYKEFIEFIAGETTEDEAITRIVVRTRQFAARQERWFRRDPRVRWIDVEDDPVAEVAPAVIDVFLDRP
jgi:tRNA dimethylallyltransferase